MMFLFLASLGIGIVSVIAGVGGGVLFVPLIGSFLPIHIDLVRGAGLLVALTGAISAAPRLLDENLSRVHVAIPLALFGSVGSILGARFGLVLAPGTVRFWLGVFMLIVAAVTLLQGYCNAKAVPAESPARAGSFLAARWGLDGSGRDLKTGKDIPWQARRVFPAMIAFLGVGFLGGVFGVGAGWANIPVLTLLMGLPLKLAAATSGLIIIVNSSAAASVYLDRGAVEPTVVVPAVLGMIIGARIGARLLKIAAPGVVRFIVIVVLLASALRCLTGG